MAGPLGKTPTCPGRHDVLAVQDLPLQDIFQRLNEQGTLGFWFHFIRSKGT
jgi:hypothetical protein